MKRTTDQNTKIQTMRAKLGIDPEDFRESLRSNLPGKRWPNPKRPSTSDLTVAEAGAIIEELERISRTTGVKTEHPGKPNNINTSPKLQKIQALLTIGQKPWSYATSILKRMYKVERLEFANQGQLTGVISALNKVGKKEGWDIHE